MNKFDEAFSIQFLLVTGIDGLNGMYFFSSIFILMVLADLNNLLIIRYF